MSQGADTPPSVTPALSEEQRKWVREIAERLKRRQQQDGSRLPPGPGAGTSSRPTSLPPTT